jgi:predicted nucleotidyltransferase component of viral defense system
MIETIRAHLAAFPMDQQRNAAREYVQRLVLQALDDAGYRRNLAFTGGTCLRIVYGVRRYSEDLDFSLHEKTNYDTKTMSASVLTRLSRFGFTAEAGKVKDEKTVASFFIQLIGFLQALGLSPIRDEKLSVKVEVDKNPPAGGTIEEFLAPEPVPFFVNHFDLASLFATKLHALLFRRYEKGRDYYDLFYFLGRRTIPSLKLFQAAVKQTHPNLSFPTLSSVKDAMEKKLSSMDEKHVWSDVGSFLSDLSEERFLKEAALMKALDQAEWAP